MGRGPIHQGWIRNRNPCLLRLFIDYRPVLCSNRSLLTIGRDPLTVRPYPVSVRNRRRRYPSQVGRPSLTHRRTLPEVVQLNLSYGGHDAESLHVDGVHDRLKPNLTCFNHLHERGGGVQIPAEAIRFPTDDDVEQPLSRLLQLLLLPSRASHLHHPVADAGLD